MVLGIEEEPQTDIDTIVVDFHGNQMEVTESADRWKLIAILVSICAIVNVLFVNGCVISIEYLTSGKKCPDKSQDCFIFQSRMSMTPSQSFVCDAGQAGIPVNSSVYAAVCYRYILGDQKAVDVLNQLGICTGVLSLSTNILWLLCWMMSHRQSKFILGLIIMGIGIVISVVSFVRGPLEPAIFVLDFLWLELVGMTMWIIWGENRAESIQNEVQELELITIDGQQWIPSRINDDN